MSNQELTPIDVRRAIEAIQQERETFDLRKKHEQRWFLLRYSMGWISIALITGIMAASCIILINSSAYPSNVIIGASAALFVDILGLAAAVWKIVLNPSFVTRLEPITKVESHSLTTTETYTGKKH